MSASRIARYVTPPTKKYGTILHRRTERLATLWPYCQYGWHYRAHYQSVSWTELIILLSNEFYTEGSFPTSKLPEREANHSPPCGAEVKNGRREVILQLKVNATPSVTFSNGIKVSRDRQSLPKAQNIKFGRNLLIKNYVITCMRNDGRTDD
jgi:hypothetical protein